MLLNQTNDLDLLSRLQIQKEELIEYLTALSIQLDTRVMDDNLISCIEDYIKKKHSMIDGVDLDSSSNNEEIEKNLLDNGKRCYENDLYVEAFNYFYLAYRLGDMYACYMLGRIIEEDFFIYCNKTKALEYYTLAKQTVGEAMYRLAECYRDGVGCEKDYLNAVKLFKLALKQGFNSPSDYENIDQCVQNMYKQQVEKGNIEGYSHLANYLIKKKGMGYDSEQVKECFILGAEIGDASSLHRMGIYEEEDNNEIQAKEYFIQAAKKGNVQSIFRLQNTYGINIIDIIKESPEALLAMGEYYSKKGDIQQALQCYIKSAELGSDEAQYRIGVIYTKYPSYETDLDKNHIYWLKLASDKGNANASYKLGVCYEGNDTIVEENKRTAFELFEKAALAGQILAQSKLGFYYKRGIAVERNFDKSYEWYLKGAENGHSIAQNQLAFCYLKGEGVEKDWEKAFYWFEKAAEQKHYISLYQLGLCYMYGRGTTKDLQKAKECLEQALDNGYDTAQKQLDVLNKLDKLNGNSNIENLKNKTVLEEVTSMDIQRDIDSLNRVDNTIKIKSENVGIKSDIINGSVDDLDLNLLSEKQCIELMFRLQDRINADVLNDVIAQQRLDEIVKEDKVKQAKELLTEKGFTAEQLELLKDYFNKE